MTWNCPGDTEDHCCYLNGPPCHFLEENTVPGRRWACGLYRELGSWDKVHSDERYVTQIKPVWESSSLAGYDCGDWPNPGRTCATCGGSG